MESENQPLPDAALELLARLGTGIEYTESEPDGIVNLTESDVTDDDLGHLVFYPGFAALDLTMTQITDAGLRFIGEMRSLENLRLYQTHITDEGVKELGRLSRLERLDIGTCPGCFPQGLRPVPAAHVHRNQITNEGLRCLTDMLALRALELKATRITDEGLLSCLPEMPQLQELNLAFLDITDKGLCAVDGLSWLERINLSHTAVSYDAIVRLVNEKAHTLVRLNLSNTGVIDAGLAEFPEQSRLQSLSLLDTGITDEGLRHVARFDRLQRLRLDMTEVSDDGIRHLAACEPLQKLELYKTNVTDTSLIWLSDSRIEHLGLGATSVTDAGMPALTEFADLRSLDLQFTAVTDNGLRFLSQASQLQVLYLEHTAISNAGLSFLIDLPLETLSLNMGISDAGLNVISKIPTLKHLAIWHGVESWKHLAQSESLQVLLIDDSVKELSPLHKLRQLKVLLLSGEKFSSTEVARLRLALPECRIKSYRSLVDAVCDFRSLSTPR